MNINLLLRMALAGLALVTFTPAMATDLLVNGGFDLGPGPPWEEYDGGTGYPLIVHESAAHVTAESGEYYAWLGGIFDGMLCLSQDVEVPSWAGQLELVGVKWIQTEEVGSQAWDTITIFIHALDGTPLEQLSVWSNLDTTPSWDEFSLEISDVHAGNSIRLVLCSQNDATEHTSFFIDSLALNGAAPSAVEDVSAPRPNLPLLLDAYPNPFNPQTMIAFEIPSQQDVTLHVFDLSGRFVRSLVAGEIHTPGRHEVVWNGRDESGRQVASGTYFYRLEAGAFAETKRMVLIK